MDKLPNDSLISIVSRLPVKEAGRTSVLARRWRNIWKFNRILNFDGSKKLESINSSELEFERERFVGWVKRVASLHCGENIDEFSAVFNLNNLCYANEIDKWIEFAVRKRVQKLELNFQSRVPKPNWIDSTSPDLRGGSYSFPNVTKYLNNLPFSLSLVSLSLTRMLLPQQILDSFMSNCPTLEHLHLQFVKGFTVFPLSFEATRLSRLALIHCRHFERIETDPNRVSSLIHLTLGAPACSKLLTHLDELSGCLSGLETLTLHMGEVSVRNSKECQSLPRLKKLVLRMEETGEVEAVVLARLIMNAAPLLQEMVLMLIPVADLQYNPRPCRPQYSPMGRKHHSLRALEIRNYAGVEAAMEVALYVLQKATALDKVFIDGPAGTTAHRWQRVFI